MITFIDQHDWDEHHARLRAIENDVELLMSAVSDIASSVAVVTQVASDIQTAIATLASDVTALTALIEAGGENVDTSALVAATAALQTADSALAPAVNAVTALVPPAPAAG